jgi:isoquinoline 1-oxidoreductase beta subunit
MSVFKTRIGRRSFIKNVSLGSGGMVIGFSWLASCNMTSKDLKVLPKEWFEFNAYLKIGDNGMITIQSPNPEIGQNVKTSMPMIVAEELDADWNHVIVEQAPLNTSFYKWQVAGGSRSISSGWEPLRMAGATARKMLITAAASQWNVLPEEIQTNAGIVSHKASGNSAHYGEMAAVAAKLEVPEEVTLKNAADYKIIGHSKKNVDAKDIVTGKPLFGLDVYKEGMLTAMIVHPPAFGKKLKSFNPDSVKNMPGIKDVFEISVYSGDKQQSAFDITAFNELVVIVGNSTWQVMKAKKAIQVEWELAPSKELAMEMFGNVSNKHFPAGLENTSEHKALMKDIDFGDKRLKLVRKDGDPEKAFKNAAKIIERTYTAPFRAHNTMEPMNFFADVTAEKVFVLGPVQTPEWTESSLSRRLGIPKEKIDVHLTRMGGGFGRRLYGHFVTEAALISQKMKAPVKLVYTREDDMTFGTYRPSYVVKYKAALDKNNNLVAVHVIGGGIPERALYANRFPAGAVDNFIAEEWEEDSNITTGAYRAPRSNFAASAEQSFLDEVAELAGKDPIDFRLDLFKKAIDNPVGERNDYDAKRYAGVLELVKEKSNWGKANTSNLKRGVAAYFCHNSYVANVIDLVMDGNVPKVQNVYCAVDCGIVINPDAATNLAEGGAVDAIGTALFGEMTFEDGVPQQSNFDKYRLIKHHEAPKNIQVDFVKNEIAPTGMGEPPFPPVMGALSNAIYSATGKRVYHQPFINELNA